jgi:hypothetical protein
MSEEKALVEAHTQCSCSRLLPILVAQITVSSLAPVFTKLDAGFRI